MLHNAIVRVEGAEFATRPDARPIGSVHKVKNGSDFVDLDSGSILSGTTARAHSLAWSGHLRTVSVAEAGDPLRLKRAFMKTILIVDDLVIVRELIATALESRGYRSLKAENGADALRTVAEHDCDLILLDIIMPIMDGMTFLRRLRELPLRHQPPVILLTAHCDRAEIVEAARLGARHYLLKSRFSSEDLLHRIETVLSTPEENHDPASAGASPNANEPIAAPSDATDSRETLQVRARSTASLKAIKPIESKSSIVQQLEEAASMRAMPPVVTKLLKLTGSETATVHQVAETIRQDQAIAIKILRLANSCLYTRGEPVETLQTAVLRIGMGQIRQAMINLGLVDSFSSFEDGAVKPGPFWEHSIGCGLIAAEIAREFSTVEPDLAFTMGLVHDMGRMLCSNVLGERYIEVLATAEQLQLPVEVVESRLLGVNHAEAMDRVLHQWHFSRDLIDPVVFHHLSVENARNIAPRRLNEVATLALADRITHALMLGSSGNDTLYATESFCETLRVPEGFFEMLESTIPAQTEDMRLAIMAQSSSYQWTPPIDEFRQLLTDEFRPLYVSEQPGIDAFHTFCKRIAVISGEPPNIAVVHLRNKTEIPRVSEELGQRESELGVRLPLLVICTGGLHEIPGAVSKDRHAVILQSPVPIRVFLDAVNQLSDRNASLANAA
jgi:HD-like signal output (HDOD) protein/CheY-like chemotaxis protein